MELYSTISLQAKLVTHTRTCKLIELALARGTHDRSRHRDDVLRSRIHEQVTQNNNTPKDVGGTTDGTAGMPMTGGGSIPTGGTIPIRGAPTCST